MIVLKDVFEGMKCTIIGNEKESVGGIAYRSDKVKKGDIFFCIVGFKTDGHSFAQDAIERGASVIVVERNLYLAETDHVTIVVVDDSRKAMAYASSQFYGNPSHDFSLVGITGTNGKTTTTYLVEQIAKEFGKKTGVIGTVGTKIGNDVVPSARTTPESPDLQAIFSKMSNESCDVVAMEVSSHALDLLRTWGTQFAVSAFTNLTQDHLDYHHTFEDYFEAKARLFSADYPAKRVICIDDEWGKTLHERCIDNGDQIITTGFNPAASIHPLDVTYHDDSTTVSLMVMGVMHTFTYTLVGRFNVENIMTAFGIGCALGIPHEVIIQALEKPFHVPGRLQRIEAAPSCPFSVFVDYAHTPDALRNALSSLRALCQGKLIVVFGCGGDRDTSKRSIMGNAALDSDYAIVTSDNPRSEDPHAIISDIVSGMTTSHDCFTIEEDRRKAIELAIEIATAGDMVLIAGKGHENYQIIKDVTIHFDDAEVAFDALQKRFS